MKITKHIGLTSMLCMAILSGCAESERATQSHVPSPTQRDLRSATPQVLMDEFEAEVGILAEGYPELNGFPEYARARTMPLTIHYSRGLRDSRKTPDGIQRSFDPKGIYLWFLLEESLHLSSVTGDQVTDLHSLKLTLVTEMALAEDATDGLEDTLHELVEKYKALLIKLNNETANKASEPTSG